MIYFFTLLLEISERANLYTKEALNGTQDNV